MNHRFLSTQAGKKFRKEIIERISSGYDWFFSLRLSSAIIYVVVCLAFAIFLIIDTADDRRRLMSAFGIVILVRDFADVIRLHLAGRGFKSNTIQIYYFWCRLKFSKLNV